MSKSSIAASILFVFLAFAISTGYNSQPAAATHVACGSTIAADTVMDSDILDCEVDTGITIVADNIVLDCAGHTVDGLVYNVEGSGILAKGRLNITIKNCVVTDWPHHGIVLEGTSSSTVQGNNASSNKFFGIRLFSNSSNNTVSDNIAGNNGREGVRIGPFANYNTIANNTANSNQAGFLIYNSAYNTLKNNIANSNSVRGIAFSVSAIKNTAINSTFKSNQYGVTMQNNASNNALINSTIANSLLWDFFSGQNAPHNRAENLNLGGTVISFTATDISLKKSGLQPADPAGYQNLSRYINATNNSGVFMLFLNFSYTDSEVVDLDEGTLTIARHNGTWNTAPAQFANVFGVDAANNVVFANITNFGSMDYMGSIFAPLGQPDTGVPTITNVNASNITNSSAVITWDTNKPANSTVLFGTTPTSLASSAFDAAFVKQHNVSLAGLSANTIYYYNVIRCRDSGICSSAGIFNFTTAATTGTAPAGTTLVTESVPNGTLVTLVGNINTTFIVPYGSSVDLTGVAINASQNLTVITGLNLPAGVTKTAQVIVSAGANQTCVADTENATLSASCNQTYETIVPCPGAAGNYTCSSVNSTLYSISNLTHSAIGSFVPAQNPANSNPQPPQASSSSSSGGGTTNAAPAATPVAKTANANNPQITQNPDAGSGNPNPTLVPAKSPVQNGITESLSNKNSNVKGSVSTGFISLVSKINPVLEIIAALIAVSALGIFYAAKKKY